MAGRDSEVVSLVPSPSWLGRRRRWCAGALVGLLSVALSAEASRVLLGSNFHAVRPHELYRCAQPSPAVLDRLIREQGIRTVINLRGNCAAVDFYQKESTALQTAGVDLQDVRLSAGRLPPVPAVRRLVEIFDRASYPMLVHCRRGSDRTGMVSAIYLLLKTDTPLERAERQLSPRYGHIALGRPANLGRFFDLYREWLAGHGWEHAPDRFRAWVADGYRAGECTAAIEPIDIPSVLPCGKPAAIRLRFTNRSSEPWGFRPGRTAGIHVVAVIHDDRGVEVGNQRSGMLQADVAAGEFIDLSVLLPPVAQPGRYHLIVDLVDEQHCLFFQAGSEPLEREVEFR